MLSVQPFHNYPGLQQGVLTGAEVGSLEDIRPLYYLDDWLVLAESVPLLLKYRKLLLWLCQELGVVIKLEQCFLTFFQVGMHL